MRLVDGEERDAQAVEQGEGALAHQALRRDVEQVEPARAGAVLDRPDFAEGERGVEIPGAHPCLPQGVDLVLHQRDEGGDDDRDAGTEQGGDLVAQRLAAAGGHDHQAIAAARDVPDDRFLLASKRAVSEDAIEDLARRPMHGPGCYCPEAVRAIAPAAFVCRRGARRRAGRPRLRAAPAPPPRS